MERNFYDDYILQEYERIQIYLSSKNFKEDSLFYLDIAVYLDSKLIKEQLFPLNGDKDQRTKTPLEVFFIFERQQRIQVNLLNKEKEKTGEISFTVGELIGSKNKTIIKKLKENGEEEIRALFEGILPSQNQEIRESYQHLFIEYLKGNLKISGMICVDFTASNQAMTTNQLHKISTNELNEYQQAIAAVCKIILDYDHDQLVPLFGFGAVPLMPGFEKGETNHFFPLTFDWKNPAGKGMLEIFRIYSSAISRVKMTGPTLFSPLLEETIKFTNKTFEKNKYHYTILLILTDGIIHDMEETIDLIVEAANLPISILIVGVGTEDFSSMEELDSDGKIMRNSKGHVAKRDIVQFVDYSKFKHRNMNDLVAEVLKEVPKQICTFYKLKGIDPRIEVFGRDLGQDESEFEPLKRDFSEREIPDERVGFGNEVPSFIAGKMICGLNDIFKSGKV